MKEKISSPYCDNNKSHLRTERSKSVYYKSERNQSEFDNLSFRDLIKKHIALIFELENNEEVLQAVHNLYAKKLKFPAAKVVKADDIDSYGVSNVVKTKDDEQNVIIAIDKYLELSAGVLSSISTVIHETKHMHQAYIYHKFKLFGVVPKSQQEKMLILFRLFCEYGCGENYFYHANPEELDAFIFEFKEVKKLTEKHNYLNTENFILFRKEFIFKLLYFLRYNKEGVNNKFIKHTIKNLKRNIYCAMMGNYGLDVQLATQKIVNSGFDVEKSFIYIVEELNMLCDELIIDNLTAQEQNIKLNMAKNGNLIYKMAKTSVHNKQISETSRYAQFLKQNQYKDQKEYMELIESINSYDL